MDYSKKLAQIFFQIFIVAISLRQAHTYGFDSGGACDTNGARSARRGRAQLIASIPCDLSQQSYCNLPGNSYPWHAVRRFVHENQGLMKRMYGDIRQMSVLKTEFQENFIETEDMQETADRYSKKRYRSMKMKQEPQLGKKNRKSDTIMEPHFRLQTSTPTKNNSIAQIKSQSNKNVSEPDTSNTETTLRPDISVSTARDYYLLASNDSKFDQEIETNKVASDEPKTNETSREEVDITVVTLPMSTDHKTTSVLETSSKEVHSTTTQTYSSEFQKTNSNLDINSTEELDDSSEHAEQDEEDVTPSMTGQLFQDTIEKQATVQVNMRGVNACPVKEEVVAPFWANNTRGETLALLNLYPFEQYVHWEKCTFEHKQMYCRDGCRCEQQFSLHRLLAYDPHNECRGIFSDWFKFPSCCICKCYDVPFDYRVTSRSPRATNERHPLEVAQDIVRSAMYEHSSDEFYRPKDFDLYTEEEEEEESDDELN